MNESGIDLDFDLHSQDNFNVGDGIDNGDFYKLKSRALEALSFR